jgi:16S rRNA (adenine1518-N6/adenine1519-N6)-dimethyltransferase
MLQREVAERIAASPGGKEYGFLSVLVQLYTAPRIEFLVPPGAFSPPPDVESAVITLAVLDRPAIALTDEPFFFRLVKESFSQRRKTLRNALRRLGLPLVTADDVARRTGIDLARRPETLSVAEFGALADALR